MSTLANHEHIPYRAPLRSRDLPLPARWVPREKALAERRLTQFVFLSMLLHTLAILIFGAPMGGSPEGRAMWGSLQVVLKRSPPPPAPVETEVAPSPRPEAAYAFPPLLDRLPEVSLEPLAPLNVPPPSEVQVVPAPEIPKMMTMPPMPERRQLPAVESVPTLRIPAETPSIPAPLLQPIPTVTQPVLPAVESAPSIRVPAETPRIPAPLLQPIPTVPDRSTLPPVDAAPRIESIAPPVPVETPRVPATRPEMAPAPARPESAPPVRPEAAPAVRPEAPPAVRPEAAPSPRPASPAPSPRPDVPAPSFRQAPASTDSKDFDPTKPALDLDQIRKRAGEIQREGTGNRALLPFPMPAVPKKKTSMEEAIENARKPDCREAYKGLGLAAIVPLLANEIGEGTCRW